MKTRLKDSLAVNLAGGYLGLSGLGGCRFPRIIPLPPAPRTACRVPGRPGSGGGCPTIPAGALLRVDRLRGWLKEEGRGLPPDGLTGRSIRQAVGVYRPHPRAAGSGSTSPGTSGGSKKPPGEYQQASPRPDVCAITRRAPRRVRCALETRFLVVRPTPWNLGLAALSGPPPNLAVQVSAWLIATGGEAFEEQEWHDRLEPPRCQQLITRLKSRAKRFARWGGPDAADRPPVAPGVTCPVAIMNPEKIFLFPLQPNHNLLVDGSRILSRVASAFPTSFSCRALAILLQVPYFAFFFKRPIQEQEQQAGPRPLQEKYDCTAKRVDGFPSFPSNLRAV